MLQKTTFLFCGLSILVLFLAACTTTSEAPSVELTDEQGDISQGYLRALSLASNTFIDI